MVNATHKLFGTLFYYFFAICCFALTAVAVWGYYIAWYDCNPFFSSINAQTGICEPIKDLSKWGQTGDFFGGIINPLVGLTTVILLLRTLKQNQEALDTSKEELKRSSEALSLQSKLMASEHRERAFVRMSERLELIISKEFNLSEANQEKPLVVMLKYAARSYLDSLHTDQSTLPTSPTDKKRSNLFYKQFPNQLPYLRALSEIYKLELDDDARKMLVIHLLSVSTPTYFEAVHRIVLLRKSKNKILSNPNQDEKLLSMLGDIRVFTGADVWADKLSATTKREFYGL